MNPTTLISDCKKYPKIIGFKKYTMKIIVISCFIVLFGLSNAAYANCSYNGRQYPTGSKVGSYVCQPDGTWSKTS